MVGFWRTRTIAALREPWHLRADVVLLARVLHDWNDNTALRILRQAHSALVRGGQIFVVEMLIPEEDVAGSLCDLHLLMATGARSARPLNTQRSWRRLISRHARFGDYPRSLPYWLGWRSERRDCVAYSPWGAPLAGRGADGSAKTPLLDK